MYKISIIACVVLMVVFIGVSSLEFSKDGKQEDDSMIIANPPTQEDYPTLDGEIDNLKSSYRTTSTIPSPPQAQEIEQFQTIAYYIMPKSIDLLIKNVFSVEEDKEEIYKLIWEWQGYKYDEEREMIVLPNLYYDDLLYIKAVENFIEWLYEHDYEIAKKKEGR